MAIDPDVQVELDKLKERLEVLEKAPVYFPIRVVEDYEDGHKLVYVLEK